MVPDGKDGLYLMPKNLIVRTDAALHIGTGHVMRCLALANTLKLQDVRTLFICREHKGHLAETIIAQGHECVLLPKPTLTITQYPDPDLPAPHSGWLGETWQKDLWQIKSVLGNRVFDWLVVDHYGLDNQWESNMRNIAGNIMVIDDLADRNHDCDLLLDQTPGQTNDTYELYVPKTCKILAGSQYALLRPEFHQWREYSLKRRHQIMLKRLLVNIGGIDMNNITGDVLDILAQCQLHPDIEITVVMGSTAPHIERVQKQAKHMDFLTEVKTNVANMAEIMANSDLAIGAAGSTALERCCLGLPSLMFVLAKNQENIALSLEESNAAILLHDASDIIKHLSRISESPHVLPAMSYAAKKLVHGNGLKSVANYILDIQ